eukprot:PhM_4_TR5331/c0_g1_i1/m.46228
MVVPSLLFFSEAFLDPLVHGVHLASTVVLHDAVLLAPGGGEVDGREARHVEAGAQLLRDVIRRRVHLRNHNLVVALEFLRQLVVLGRKCLAVAAPRRVELNEHGLGAVLHDAFEVRAHHNGDLTSLGGLRHGLGLDVGLDLARRDRVVEILQLHPARQRELLPALEEHRRAMRRVVRVAEAEGRGVAGELCGIDKGHAQDTVLVGPALCGGLDGVERRRLTLVVHVHHERVAAVAHCLEEGLAVARHDGYHREAVAEDEVVEPHLGHWAAEHDLLALALVREDEDAGAVGEVPRGLHHLRRLREVERDALLQVLAGDAQVDALVGLRDEHADEVGPLARVRVLGLVVLRHGRDLRRRGTVFVTHKLDDLSGVATARVLDGLAVAEDLERGEPVDAVGVG